jgi:hypothetical protein
MGDPSKTEPSPSVQLRIDGPCLRFERCWRAGERPSLEAFLAEAPENDRSALLEELLLLEWTYRRRRGEAVAPDEYRANLPGCEEGVERAWRRWTGAETGADEGEHATTPPQEAQGVADWRGAPAGFEDVVAVGRGGMGIVYRAFDPRLKRLVALKRVLPERVTPEGLRRFRLEARAVARLRHPHVVQVYAWEEPPEGPMLVMEYVSGGSMEAWLRGRSLTPPEAARFVAILARAVQAAHDAGIVHRDLKPDNVLLGEAVPGNSGTVAGVFPKVTDFGLSMLVGDDRQTRQGTFLGTPQYAPPEQAGGDVEALGPKADTWALGVILYRCLSGRLPFKGGDVLETLELIRKRPAPPLRLAGEAALERLCLRCLEKDPERRPSAGELADELDRLASGAVPPAVPRRRTWAVAAGLIGAMALAVVLLGWRLWPGSGEAGQRSEETPKDDNPAARGAEKPAEALTVRALRVMHTPPERRDLREMGKEVFGARFGDLVRVEAELSEPAYAFLIAFTPDGKHVLLWPADEKGDPDERRPPPRAKTARYHATDEDGCFRLDENPDGGTQAFVVVASRRPLPAFAEWSKGWTKRPWRARPAQKVVWASDGDWTDTKKPEGVKRSLGATLPDQPLLKPLCRGLREAGADVVEGIAFGVEAKEAK